LTHVGKWTPGHTDDSTAAQRTAHHNPKRPPARNGPRAVA
jgi:hypothetical protein